jgi:hypothetical protein
LDVGAPAGDPAEHPRGRGKFIGRASVRDPTLDATLERGQGEFRLRVEVVVVEDGHDAVFIDSRSAQPPQQVHMRRTLVDVDCCTIRALITTEVAIPIGVW